LTWAQINFAKEFLAVGRSKTEGGEVSLPPQNVLLSKAVLKRKGSENDEVEAGTFHA
jgi:hypothetical protein